ncbi:MAG: sortase [Clostridia bacterium]|nr:sortase [Clostridia bacterium]
MVEKKFNKVLTAILIIILVSIFVILGFLAYNMFLRFHINSDANKAIDEFDNKIEELGVDEDNTELVESEGSEGESGEDSESGGSGNSGGRGSSRRGTRYSSYSYKGFNVIGKIEIPKTKIKYPVFDVATISSMQVSVGMVYGPGLNEIGNTVIMGHNYRNGTFFSNNNRIANGDYIYITDAYGWRLRYRVYNTYITNSSDFDYATRDTNGKREISLASCTNDSKSRIIIWAREK